jgi:hypothetical protein
MSDESIVRALFDRWERVWHERRFELVAGCVAPTYIRHDESGTRAVTPDDYATEIAAAQRERPNTRRPSSTPRHRVPVTARTARRTQRCGFRGALRGSVYGDAKKIFHVCPLIAS